MEFFGCKEGMVNSTIMIMVMVMVMLIVIFMTWNSSVGRKVRLIQL